MCECEGIVLREEDKMKGWTGQGREGKQGWTKRRGEE